MMGGERVKMSKSRTLARVSKREHGEERVDSTVKKGDSKEEMGGKQEEPPLER